MPFIQLTMRLASCHLRRSLPDWGFPKTFVIVAPIRTSASWNRALASGSSGSGSSRSVGVFPDWRKLSSRRSIETSAMLVCRITISTGILRSVAVHLIADSISLRSDSRGIRSRSLWLDSPARCREHKYAKRLSEALSFDTSSAARTNDTSPDVLSSPLLTARVTCDRFRTCGRLDQSLSSSVSMHTTLPANSLPQRPARPAKFQKSPSRSGLPFPFLGLRIKIVRHGRFTPSSKVEVQIK